MDIKHFKDPIRINKCDFDKMLEMDHKTCRNLSFRNFIFLIAATEHLILVHSIIIDTYLRSNFLQHEYKRLSCEKDKHLLPLWSYLWHARCLSVAVIKQINSSSFPLFLKRQ